MATRELTVATKSELEAYLLFSIAIVIPQGIWVCLGNRSNLLKIFSLTGTYCQGSYG